MSSLASWEVLQVGRSGMFEYNNIHGRRLIAAGSFIASFGGLLLLALGMHRLYELPQFGERPAQWMLIAGLAVCSGLFVLLVSPISQRSLAAIEAPVGRFGLWAVAALAAVAFVGFCLAAHYVLQGFPNSADEFAYALQAETYAQGKLWADPPPIVEAFRQSRFFDVGDKWVSQYPPGWALVLAPAAALGLPLWVVTALLGAVTLFAFFCLARLYVSSQTAWIGVITLGTSAFFILNSASFFSHNLAAFCGVLFALMGLRYVEKGDIWHALVAGACLGLMGLTRTHNAMIFAIPLVVTLAMTPSRRTGLIWLGLAGLPFLLTLLAYNYQITSDPFTGVANHNESDALGALTSKTLWLTVSRFRELPVWTSPILVFGYVFTLSILTAKGRLDFTDYIMPLTLLFFLFYSGDGGNQYGPRYYFEAWPFAILTMLKAADPVLSGSGQAVRWISAAFVASLLFQLSYLPARFERERRVVEERQAVYNAVKEAGLKNAIVIIAESVGKIRPMPPDDLLRNGLNFNEREILYVGDLGEQNSTLASQFPGRDIYVFSDGRLMASHDLR